MDPCSLELNIFIIEYCLTFESISKYYRKYLKYTATVELVILSLDGFTVRWSVGQKYTSDQLYDDVLGILVNRSLTT